jgi:putative membrane protein
MQPSDFMHAAYGELMNVERLRLPLLILATSAALLGCGENEDRMTQPGADTPAPAPTGPGAPLDHTASSAGAGAPPSIAGTPPGGSAAGAAAQPLSTNDQAFVADAAGSGMAEIEAGRLVAGKTRDTQVKAFAERLHEDHTAANIKLSRLATAKGLDVSDEVPAAQRKHLNELQKLDGVELDHAFLTHFGAAAHERTIALFERQLSEGKDQDLRAFAEETLSVLRSHLQTAQSLQKAGSGSAR